ncbi:hypothetical protein GUITHDRAFT_110070 [Guillardia theta CCMP2712]|uniref:Sushi domain-containing protein n=1 Tax=Guillardia theta (strain CCMP2712) TaxID=905079 RepID=L1J601_GUITC|nr:hypothetical protein GUITHDRAFT_110070 [Guillardia theta CCMP2712]EKX43963.1 hypothetical protein GUITHDRAFT_110070 [Guillardia theta CCMP2712]|eukprot:XP_005830943.1 hypothetical protein GUITHDRAFT_110070 [Guillardia theta CCMP2712]
MKVGTTLQLQSNNGPLQLTIDSPPDKHGGVKVRVRGREGQYEAVLQVKRDGVSEGGRKGEVRVLDVGELRPSSTSAGNKKLRSLKLVSMPQGWYAYDPMEEISGKETRFAGIHIEAPSCGCPGCPCDAEAHLKIDVFCPPYIAPDHGSVWYKGRQFNDSTSEVPTSRRSIRIGSKTLPVAQKGDIPEGDVVQITCNEHFQLSREGSEIPRCLSTGEFQRGKTCEPIMCSAYYPPTTEASGRTLPYRDDWPLSSMGPQAGDYGGSSSI